MSYVDGFMAPVPTANREAYLKHCKDAAAVFKEYGATRVVETWGLIYGGFKVILDV
ncbi:DUF1428 family protein [Hydrogenophaga borbori]|jgi:uncharacterized protein YbaA (DUF1428 family)|uniref:DUF1428 family protein n=1 Tax=Hydrogenophaga borbori TaxID=2294117 RepID=UPI0026983116